MLSFAPCLVSRTARVVVLLIVAAVVTGVTNAQAASISVTWDAPTTNADGTPLMDLAGYRIYLDTAPPACPSDSFLEVPSSSQTPTLGEIGAAIITALSGGVTYFARVTAVDTSGLESSCSPSASGVAQSDFTVAPAGGINFGTLVLGALLDRTFTVQNTSGVPLTGSASVGSPFSIVSGGTFSLAPGATQTVTVRFRPLSLGSFAGNVTFIAGDDSISRGVSGSTTGGSTATLSVTRNGTGAGTVTSSTGGITCGTQCSETMAVGTPVTLSASPAAGSTFAGWAGACSGSGTCAVTVNAATAATATFNVSASGSTSSSAPATPSSPSVTQIAADGTGVTFAVAWASVSAAASYEYTAAFNDGTSSQQGVVLTPSLQLRMPYRLSGGASTGFVCVQSISVTGLRSADRACNAIPIPARPTSSPPPEPTPTPASVPMVSSLSPSSAVAGSAALTLTVNGSGFVAGSGVRWNGASRSTTFVSATQLRASISTSDLATARSVAVTVVTPAPGGGTSGSATFTVSAAPPPAAPPAPSVTRTSSDSTGVNFTIAWGPATGATSYTWFASFDDSSAPQQGSLTGRSFSLRMPYHASGAAFGATVCIRSVNAAGLQSTSQSCSAVPVPARPVTPPPPPPPPPPPQEDYGWGVG